MTVRVGINGFGRVGRNYLRDRPLIAWSCAADMRQHHYGQHNAPSDPMSDGAPAESAIRAYR
ncbi:hypothetical protein OG897_30640 [Streptomyces sp. NBC_00237]|uniref:hypothetical protein n=1 Tax=Streptomyces sp. NBC_00237 TaxID=2975687 RepID=UPI00225514D5|nr:hypothetical protein [Streptomyces sp. NBC_00237]MCX5205794.1 hypothetical protein [Streptomyces sp. NBC_00237]